MKYPWWAIRPGQFAADRAAHFQTPELADLRERFRVPAGEPTEYDLAKRRRKRRWNPVKRVYVRDES